MAKPEELSLSEIVQKIVDLQETQKTDIEKETDKLKYHLIGRHNNHTTLKSDLNESMDAILELVQQYNSEKKAERERVLKKVVAVRFEILVDSILYQERRLKEGLIKNRKEYVDLTKKLVTRVVEALGKVLEIGVTGTIYYPFVLRMCRCLVGLSTATGYFIPVTYYLLYMMNQMVKTSPSSLPVVPVASTAVKVPEKYINSSVYREYVMTNSLDLIVECLKLHSQSLSFPEYSAYVVGELKRVRNSHNRSSPWVNSKADAVVKAVRDHAERIEKIREGLSVIDSAAVRRLEENIPEFELNIE
ncbi:uncharacterized protein NEMAJ01_2101 [Nematocida major]|uniref:uncharacterized protein n=1 Tax=Nematocida major TaxID=1912982 RepID=UPI0020089958|nr:uncharacterized protein NEMAJ01_2101 [Nematocida major]KAH9387205.1 hypothetical protein NEMAJ01_2101 [Nematocida major]